MKLAITALFCCFAGQINAQTTSQDSAIQKILDSRSVSVNVLVIPRKNGLRNDTTFRFTPTVPYTQAGKIPCLKPDTKDIARIPNGWKGKVSKPYVSNPPRIPNSATSGLWVRPKNSVQVSVMGGKK